MGDVRLPGRHELERLRDIERAAGQLFRTVGMDAVADDEPAPVAELEGYRRDGRAFVVADADELPVAYLLVEVLDGNAHVEQVSVHPDQAGRGLGGRLLEHAARWAAEQGLPALTLTTFRDVGWNAPYYERCGFAVMAEQDIGPQLRRRRHDEAEHGLDPDLRVCMRRLT